VGWLPAKHLSRFDFEEPNSDQIPEFDRARNRYAELRGYRSYAAMKADRGIPPYKAESQDGKQNTRKSCNLYVGC